MSDSITGLSGIGFLWDQSMTKEYKIYNNEQLAAAQESNFGIIPISVSSDGQAVDSVLSSSDLQKLGHRLGHINTQYCKKYNIEMTKEKDKLQVFAPSNLKPFIDYLFIFK